MPAAKPVRNATIAKGENPCVIASLPKTGANPRNSAELKAAVIPALYFFCKNTSLLRLILQGRLRYQRFHFFQEVII